MTYEISEFYRFVYLMKETDNGWFIKAQFDSQFKGSIQKVKEMMTTVTKHTEKSGKNKMMWTELLINIEGYFDKIIGDELYIKFLDGIKNKPKCYVL